MNAGFFLLLIIIISCFQSLRACTVISAATDNKVLAATNKDWNNPDTRILIIPATEKAYGRIFFGYQVSDGFQNVGGMNAHGLWYDGASLPERSDIRNHYNKPTVEGELCEKALAECENVHEVIAMYKKYYTPHWQGHCMWADQLGNSVIIEYGEDDVVFMQKKQFYQVMTNFYVSDTTHAEWYNCYRFKTAEYLLKNCSDITVSFFRTVLDKVHAHGATPTVYSNVYDLQKKEIYVFNFHNYSEYVKIDLSEQLEKGEQYLKLPALFNQILLSEPCADDKVNSSLVTFKWFGNAREYRLYCSENQAFADSLYYIIYQQNEQSHAGMRLFLCFFFVAPLILKKRKRLFFFIIAGLLFYLTACEPDILHSPYKPSEIVFSKNIDNLKPDTKYYWKVASICENGLKNESITRTFQTE